MRVLITGGTGFIGQNVVRESRHADHSVTVWQDPIAAIGQWQQPVDVVIHLAAVSRFDQFAEAPHLGFNANVIGTAEVLRYCQRVGARCVFASSSGVYGPAAYRRPLLETDPLAPSSPYAMSKWLAERLCEITTLAHDLTVVILRLFNVYGPKQHHSFLIPDLLDALQSGRPIELRMPSAIRDFVYVDDVVEAVFLACMISQRGLHIINIGSGEGHCVSDVVRKAEHVFGRAVLVERAHPHLAEATIVIADIHRAWELLKWRPRYTLDEGLQMIKASEGTSRQ